MQERKLNRESLTNATHACFRGFGGRRGLAVVARRHRSPFGGGPETL